MNNINTEEELFPKVTVVTVTYNLIENGREQYFRQCLESVHDQIYSNVEHIVIDGASDDGTLDILEEYRKKKWITYYSEPDNGIYDAMNKGIKKTTGKYVVFLNSDDFFYHAYAISLSIETLEREQTAFSCAKAKFIENEKIVCNIAAQPEIFFLRMPFSHQTMFTRRDVLLKEKGFDTKNYKSAADYDLIVRLLMKGYTVSVVNKVISCFRGGGFSGEDSELSHKEVRLIMKKYFSEVTWRLEKKQKYKYKTLFGAPGNVYIVSLCTLNLIKERVCLYIRKSIKKIKQKNLANGFIRLKPKGYFVPMSNHVFLFNSISLFNIEHSFYPKECVKHVYRLFSIKIFEIKKQKLWTVFKILYIPILKIKHH